MPAPPFQIDGNFGATAGITEMLLQSHLRDDNGDYYQDILPALPSGLSNGKISGIRGRGGFEISIEWENERLVEVEVKSIQGNNLNLRYAGKVITKELLPMNHIHLRQSIFNPFIKINTEYERNCGAGRIYYLRWNEFGRFKISYVKYY